MRTLDYDTETIRARLRPLLERRGVTRSLLFGSRARGTHDRRSDIDIIIVQRTQKRYWDRYADFAEVYDLLPGAAIDMLIYTPEEAEEISDRPMMRQAFRE
jgi:predicted nucleotidyltransferase